MGSFAEEAVVGVVDPHRLRAPWEDGRPRSGARFHVSPPQNGFELPRRQTRATDQRERGSYRLNRICLQDRANQPKKKVMITSPPDRSDLDCRRDFSEQGFFLSLPESEARRDHRPRQGRVRVSRLSTSVPFFYCWASNRTHATSFGY